MFCAQGYRILFFFLSFSSSLRFTLIRIFAPDGTIQRKSKTKITNAPKVEKKTNTNRRSETKNEWFTCIVSVRLCDYRMGLTNFRI